MTSPLQEIWRGESSGQDRAQHPLDYAQTLQVKTPKNDSTNFRETI